MRARHLKYFLVHPESPVMSKILLAQAQLEEFIAAALELQKELGATKIWTAGSNVCGVSFPGCPPDGWRRQANAKWFSPNLRTTRGQAIRERLGNMPKDPRHPYELSRIVGFRHWADGKGYFPGVHNFDGEYVISMHVDVRAPEGCTRLSAAKFNAIQAAAKKKVAA